MKHKNKLKKWISFDLLDVELLRLYLKKMASKGWLIDEIGTFCLSFKKIAPKDLDFFIDITSSDMIDEYKMPKREYLSNHKKNNLDHIYGNKNFQIFIDNGNKSLSERTEFNFLKIFFLPIFMLILVVLYSVFFYAKNFEDGAFVFFISNNLLITCSLLLIILLCLAISINSIEVYKYTRKKQTNNANFTQSFKLGNMFIKGYICFTVLLITISIANSILSQIFIMNSCEKSDLPIKLEDFNAKISPTREYEKENYSSVFVTYNRYTDLTYNEVYKDEYDKETKETYEVCEQKDFHEIDYTLIKTKSKKIMSRIIKDRLNIYGTYKKTTDKELLKNWSAKAIYYNNNDSRIIVVYNNSIFEIYTNIKLDKNKINFIRSSILNY